MITLPEGPDARQEKTLAFAVAVWIGAAAGIAAWLTNVGPYAGVAAVAALAISLFLGRRGTARRAYRAWNSAARWYAAAASETVLFAAHLCIVVPAGLVGRSRTRLLGVADRFTWDHKRSLAADRFEDLGAGGSAGHRTWRSAFSAYAGEQGNEWAYALVPYLGLYRALAPDRKPGELKAPSRDIYTLY